MASHSSLTGKQKIFLIVSLGILGFLAYGNALSNTFVWDDQVFIVDNPVIRHVKFIPDFFTRRLSENSAWGRGFDSYYRPVFLLSFLFDYHLWGLQPFWFHLHNILLHIFCTILVFYFAKTFWDDWRFSYLSALLFCLHPIHTEAVTAVFNRMDILVSVLSLGAFLLFAEFIGSQKKGALFYFLSLVLFGFSLFAKELAAMLLPVLFFYDYLFVEKNLRRLIKRRWVYYGGFVAVFLFYFSFRIVTLGSFVAGYVHQPMYTSFAKTDFPWLAPYIVLQTLFVYIQKLIMPVNFQIVYYFILDNFWNAEVFLSFIIILISLYWIVRCRKDSPLITFFLGWFFLMVFPVSQIIPFGNIVAEHYLYLPSVGFCCLTAYLLTQLWNRVRQTKNTLLRPSFIVIGIASLCFFYLYQTIIRNYDWRNELTLWRSSASQASLSPKPYLNLANAYVDAGEVAEAERQYLKALKLKPFDGAALSSLGALYVRERKTQEGLDLMLMALRFDPDDSLTFRNIGRTYNLMGDYDKAIRYLKEAKKLNPARLELYYDLGIAYLNGKDYDFALREFKTATDIDSTFAWGYYGQGLVYYRQGKSAQAQDYFDKAIILDTNFQYALKSLYKEARPKNE